MNPSYGFASSTEQNSDPFTKPDQIIFDFSPPEKVNGPSTSNAFSSPMLNSLFQGIDNREVCGDHKDNNKNGIVDENCSALPSDEQNSITEPINQDDLIQSPPVSNPPPQDELNPEQEICGDGQDNDGNGVIDENCDDRQEEPPASNPPHRMIIPITALVLNQRYAEMARIMMETALLTKTVTTNKKATSLKSSTG